MAKIYKAGLPIADTTPITNDTEDVSPDHVLSAAAVKTLYNSLSNDLINLTERVANLEEQIQNSSE